jgi:dephospho-CoA kinase
MFVVVLTGGIASGKTSVSDLFADRGVPIIDTDLIAHQIVQPGQAALKKIQEDFGIEYLDDEGRLKRRAMREAIFSNPSLRTRLENILHPAIRAEALRQVSLLKSPWCLLVIPLYAESSHYDWVDRVLLVDVDEATQVQRVMLRDNISRKQALAILAAQASRDTRIALADDIIDNSGSRDRLKPAVDRLYTRYSALAEGN